jgi:DNA topoisomerase-1
MKLRHGRFGAFLGCSTYPECKGIVNIPKKDEVALSQEDLPACPAIDCPGHMTAKRSRYGKTFYSCSTFPECDVIVNDVSQLATKYPNHPRTPYVAKAKGRAGAKAKSGKASAAKVSKASTAKKKAPTKTGAKTATKKPRASTAPPQALSKELAAIVGGNEMPRTEVTKKIWDYIKAHNLQDPKNKRSIRPDAQLAKVFGSNDPLDMFQLAKVLSKHIGAE